MRFPKINLAAGVVFTLLIFLTQNAYANGGRGRGHGRDDDYGNRKRYYRYQRYYPTSYYYYRKLYFYPHKRYYYYYDVYPGKIYYYNWEKTTSVNNPAYLPVTSIVNMASQGVPSSVIISEIERTKSIYRLDADTLVYLQQNGVGDSVIDYMLSTSR
ncbi:MAG: hypothetical protein Q7K98_08090 [Candidatus Omnitrophota bacterium]|nr:hypothetical protein [Candidatus Omnitrophota bacterium]